MYIITENNIVRYVNARIIDGKVKIKEGVWGAPLESPIEYKINNPPRYLCANKWTYDGTTFNCIETPTELILADVAAKRYEEEIKGITLPDGTFVRTDRATQAALTSALAVVGDKTIHWKLSNGSWVTLGKATLTTMADAVFAHVQSCYQREYELSLNPSVDWEW